MDYQVSAARMLPSGDALQAIVPDIASTVQLAVTATSARTGAALGSDVWMITNTVFCHIAQGDSTVAANTGNMLLAPGERTLVLDGAQYLAVIRASGAGDGVISLTRAK